MSSITASEIWSGGSPYIPPTDGVTSVYNGNVGIDNSTPSYFRCYGNINFTGTLYQDGVEFSGSSSVTNVVKGQVLEKFAELQMVGHYKVEKLLIH